LDYVGERTAARQEGLRKRAGLMKIWKT